MKLNYDCVREVMLCLEAEPYIKLNEDGDVYFDFLSLQNICAKIPHFTKEDVYYALFNLEQAGYINTSELDASDVVYEFCVNYITYPGHEFLESIKEPSVWEKTKSVAAKAGATSLSIISQIASEIIVKLVSSQL